MPGKRAEQEVIDSKAVAVIEPPAQTAVAVRPPPQAAIGSAPEGMENLPSSAFRVPRISLTQPNSKRQGSDEHVGHFYRNTDGAYLPTIDAVILSETMNNTLWGAADAKVPECTSDDGLYGNVHGACGTCKFNRFANEELNKKLQSGQQEKHCNTGGFKIVLVNREDDEIALLGVHGTSIKNIALLNTSFRANGLSFFGAPVALGSVKEQNAKGKFYVVTAKRGTAFKGEEKDNWRARFKAMQGISVQDVEPDADDVNDSVSVNGQTDDEDLGFE